MADVATRYINGALAAYHTYDWRLLDAWGSGVTKALFDFTEMPTDNATGDPTEWTLTPVEAGALTSTATLTTVAGGALLLTTAGNDDDGPSIQVKGEAFQPANNKPIYFGIKLQSSDVTQSDFIAGLCITDTALLGGMTDGIYFENVDAATSISAVTEKDSNERQSDSLGTLVNATDVTLEFWVESASEVRFYINGLLVATHELMIPDDEVLTPSIEFLNGAVGPETMTVAWCRTIQIGY